MTKKLESAVRELCAQRKEVGIINGEFESNFKPDHYDCSSFIPLKDEAWFGKSDSRRYLAKLPDNSFILPQDLPDVIFSTLR